MCRGEADLAHSRHRGIGFRSPCGNDGLIWINFFNQVQHMFDTRIAQTRIARDVDVFNHTMRDYVWQSAGQFKPVDATHKRLPMSH